MKILNISDVITNSSSEVFCIIKSDDETVLKEIYETLQELGQSDVGEGGTFFDGEKSIVVEFSYDVFTSGVEMLLQPGIEKILEPYKGYYSIYYNN